MRYVALSLLIIVACSVRVNPQAGPFDKPAGQANVPDQCGIVTPPKDIDFKIIVIVPPKNFDRGILLNGCSGAKQIGCAAPSDVPLTEDDQLLKTPPAKVKKPHR
jgi:hypothetical protein